MRKDLVVRFHQLVVSRKTLLCYIGAFLIVTLLLVGRAGKIINPDGVEYIAVAHHYAALHFWAAINGIVSPLLSWILAVPVALSLDPFFFFRFILIGLSVFTIVGFENVLRHELMTDSGHSYTSYIYNAGLLFITSFCIYATLFTPLTPDLFSVFFIICLIIAIQRYESHARGLNAVLIGVAAGLGYYGKNYFAYFAITAYALYFVAKFLRHKKLLKQCVRHFAIALLVTFAFMGPWIGLLSIKYGHFTTNPIGSYVIGTVGPHYPGAFYSVDGLLKPPYKDSFDSREDPTFYKYSKWSPFGSAKDVKYYIKTVIPDNLHIALKIMLPELVLVLVGLAFALYESKSEKFWSKNFKASALIIGGMIYISGYCIIDLAGGFRYIWPAYILFGLAFFLLVSKLKLKSRSYILIAGTVILSFFPIHTYYNKAGSWAAAGQEQQALAIGIEKHVNIPEHTRIASNDPLEAAYVCYHLTLQCYGTPHKNQVETQLKKSNIGYVLNFKHAEPLAVNKPAVYTNRVVSVIKVSD